LVFDYWKIFSETSMTNLMRKFRITFENVHVWYLKVQYDNKDQPRQVFEGR
jgi:hypothetical protein